MFEELSFRWPDLTYWISWPTIITAAVAIGAVITGFVTSRRGRVFGILLLAFVTTYAIALTGELNTERERDYAYLIVPPVGSQSFSNEKIQLWTRATRAMNNVIACALRTVDYEKNFPVECWHFHAPEGMRPPLTNKLVHLGLDSWTIDIDGMNRLGTVRQWLDISKNRGQVVIVRSRVVRKETNEILCETPPRKGVRACQ